MRKIDTLIHARWVAPVDGRHRLLENHAVAIQHGVIEAVLPSDEARATFEADAVIERPSHVLKIGRASCRERV